MFYIRMNLRMLQHSNVECNIQMFILCNNMVYFGDFVVLVPYIAVDLYLSPNKYEYLMVLYKNYILCMYAVAFRFMY